MNMISTGSFLNEMDASNKQPTVAEKFAAVWEKKNAKAARAGGVSLMALSLAACGGSSSTTTTTTPAADPEPTTPVTPAVPVGQAFTLTKDAENIFGTAGDDTITGVDGTTFQATDVIADSSTTDNDTLTVTATAAFAATPTVAGIENVILNQTSFAAASADLSGFGASTVTLNQLQTGAAATGAVTNAGNITLNFGTGITSTTTVGQKAATNLVVNAGSATSVDQSASSATTGSITINGGDKTVTAIGKASTGTVTLAGDKLTTLTATGQNINATTKADASTIKITGVGTKDVATLSIGKAATIDNDTQDVETINISASTAVATTGSVATITDGAATTYKLTGANDIHLKADQGAGAVSLVSGKTVSSDATGASSLDLVLEGTAGQTEDLTKVTVAVDVSGTAHTGDAISVASGATINATADATADIAISAPAATATTNTLNLGVSAAQTAGITVTNVKSVNLSVTKDSNIAKLDVGTATVSASGAKALTLANTSVAKSVDASGMSGVLTATAGASTIATITGGSGNDIITVVTNEKVTVDGGAGSADELNMVANTTKATFSNFEILNGINGTVDMKASQLNGYTAVVKGNNGGGDDLIDIGEVAGSMDSTTLDLSGLTVDGNLDGIRVIVDGAADLGSTVAAGNSFTITGSMIADTITLTHISGTTTVSGGKGDDAITGGSGVDTITGGEGADTITGGLGKDVIDLAETTAAIDTVVGTTGGALDLITIKGFNVAAAADKGDNYDIDLSDLNGIVTDMRSGDGTALTTATDPTLTKVTKAYDLGGANSDILVIDGNFTSTELETALESGGSRALTVDDAGNNLAANDAYLVLYDNGTDSFLAHVKTSADPGDNGAFAADTLTVTNFVQFEGIADATTFVSNNFDIIA